jgi:hypothetical protein
MFKIIHTWQHLHKKSARYHEYKGYLHLTEVFTLKKGGVTYDLCSQKLMHIIIQVLQSSIVIKMALGFLNWKI